MIVDLDRVRRVERTSVLDCQLRPRGVGDGDKGARLPRSLRQLRPALVRFGAGKIEGEPGGDDMPIFAGARAHGVNLGADERGEII